MANHKFSKKFHDAKDRPRKIARKAYCNGCGVTFGKVHLMLHHRALERCGGRFLPEDKRAEVDARRLQREHDARIARMEAANALDHQG